MAAILYPTSGDIVFYEVQPGITRAVAGTRCPYEEILGYLRDTFVPAGDRGEFERGTQLRAVL